MTHDVEIKAFFTDEKYAAPRAKISKTASKTVISLLRFLLLVCVSFAILYPILSIVCGSFMSMDDMVDLTVKYFPKRFTLSNYRDAAKALDIPNTYINSFVIFTVTAVLQVISSTMAGYGLARFRFKLNGLFFAFVIIQMLIPPDTIMLTRYVEFRYFSGFGLLNLWGVNTLNLTSSALPLYILGITCTGLKNGLFIFLMRQYFKGLPRSLEEAAYVDGCGPFRTFAAIMIPGARTMMITVFLFSVVWMWTDMTVAPTLTTSKILVNMTYMINAYADSTAGLKTTMLKNAGVVLIILPVVIIYLICQKAFVQGIESSGLTGS